MAHGYRTLQHWNQWLTQHFLGSSLLSAEKNTIAMLTQRAFGKHNLLVGVPAQIDLLNATSIPCHSIVTPLLAHQTQPGYIESDFAELPFLTGSVDMVLLPHSLEYVDNPRQLLVEACRIIKPEGLIVVCGFNPYSTWGLKKLFSNKSNLPRKLNSINAQETANWLHLADFAIEEQTSIMFRPPLVNESIYQRLHFLEKIGSRFFPAMGGVYILIARAKIIPLTPVRLKWKKQINHIQVPTSVTGHIAR